MVLKINSGHFLYFYSFAEVIAVEFVTIIVFWYSYLSFIVLYSLNLDTGMFSTETQGNYFRYITLLSLCADALRKAFDNLPDTFEEKINKFKRHCHRLQGNSKLKELLSRNVLIFILFICLTVQPLGENSRNYTFFASLSITFRKFASPSTVLQVSYPY